MNDQKITVLSVPLNEWNEQQSLLKEISEQVKQLASKEQKELMTPKEVCEMLKIGRSTFERYMNAGYFEVVQVSKKKYSKKLVKRSELEKLINSGKL
jgi:response regulator of citrate/malate metabolism